MLSAYLDESNLNEGPVAYVCGYVFEANQITRFDQEYAREIMPMLNKLGIRSFHASHCFNQTDEFEDVESPYCKYLFRSMAEVIKKTATGGICVELKKDSLIECEALDDAVNVYSMACLRS